MARAADIHLCESCRRKACQRTGAHVEHHRRAGRWVMPLPVALRKPASPLRISPVASGRRTRRKLLLRLMTLCIPVDRPHVGLQATLRDALLAKSRENLGMTAICDDDMTSSVSLPTVTCAGSSIPALICAMRIAMS